LASDEFFCSNNVRESGNISVGMVALSVDEPVRISCLKRGLRWVSNFFLEAVDNAAWLMIELETSYPSLAFISSMTLGDPVRCSEWTVFSGGNLVWMFCVWISLTRCVIVDKTWGM